MKKFRVSRWKQLIWPQELYIDKYHVLTKKRHFPLFWIVSEESIPLSKLASIQIHRGFFFSKMIIENSGGPYPIIVNGLWNGQASEARTLLETIEQQLQNHNPDEILDLLDEDNDDRGDGGISPKIDPKTPPDSSSKKPDSDRLKAVAPPRPVKTLNQSIPKLVKRPLPVDDIEDDTYAYHFAPDNDENWDFGEDTHVPNVVKFNRVHPATIDKTELAEQKSSRKIGQVDNNWNPQPPWAPKPAAQIPGISVEEPIREVDPVLFLNEGVEQAESKKPRICKPDNSRQASGAIFDVDGHIGNLVNFWNRTREEVTAAFPGSSRSRRKLN